MKTSSKILWQLQLSNYDTSGRFILTADSNWQIFTQKAREMIKVDPNISIDVLVPLAQNCLENVSDLTSQLAPQVNVIHVPIIPNALVTRYDFDWKHISEKLGESLRDYTHVYINDPMLLRHYKALFYVNKCKPKFVLQTHFLDSPVARIVDDEISYWHGTVEACLKADLCFWHCDSMKLVFEEAIRKDYAQHIVDALSKKSAVWKDGYSITEICDDVNMSNIRFKTDEFNDKIVIWVPNRIGGLGKSFDYTNNGKFLFEIVPEVWKQRNKDFVVIAGNPNQKISNDELAKNCPAYLKLIDGPVNRDEYRWLSRRADIVVGLYTNDTNGGLASLESIEFGAIPYFPNVYEYKVYFDHANWPQDLRVAPDLSNAALVLNNLLDSFSNGSLPMDAFNKLQSFVRSYAAYEHTTRKAMNMMGLTSTGNV